MQTGARRTQTFSPLPHSHLSTGPEHHFPVSLSTQLRGPPSQCCPFVPAEQTITVGTLIGICSGPEYAEVTVLQVR